MGFLTVIFKRNFNLLYNTENYRNYPFRCFFVKQIFLQKSISIEYKIRISKILKINFILITIRLSQINIIREVKSLAKQKSECF